MEALKRESRSICDYIKHLFEDVEDANNLRHENESFSVWWFSVQRSSFKLQVQG